MPKATRNSSKLHATAAALPPLGASLLVKSNTTATAATKRVLAPVTDASGTTAAGVDGLKGERLSKKEKQHQRRSEWLTKLGSQKRRPNLANKPLLSLASDLKSELAIAKAQLPESKDDSTSFSSPSSTAGAAKPKPQQQPIKTRKAKHNQVKREAVRFQAVIGHAAFQADPFGTVKLHLENTLGSQ
ncbi:hypothetical protein BC828DRAFT_393959 [Blastocladiella britannica]|nr:hypothetical protein BC828DRAFT_393959 [Blastocladiella britannica]